MNWSEYRFIEEKEIRRGYHVIDIWILHSYIPAPPLLFTRYDIVNTKTFDTVSIN
jgi:hypothetical protein